MICISALLSKITIQFSGRNPLFAISSFCSLVGFFGCFNYCCPLLSCFISDVSIAIYAVSLPSKFAEETLI